VELVKEGRKGQKRRRVEKGRIISKSGGGAGL
jgi:hypothetical protein